MNINIEQWQVSKRAVSSEAGVVAAQHWLAARAGASMLCQGGNAVDAAVACAFALGALEPWMCGLGGSGYMVVWQAATKSALAIDFQGMLPAAIQTDDYPLDPDVPESIMGFPGVRANCNVEGYGSITVPGAVLGLAHGLARFGRLGLDRVLVPSIELAERGLPVDWFTTLMIALGQPLLERDPEASATYLRQGSAPAPEQSLPLGRLPATLRALADKGPAVFYRGRLATDIARDLQAGGSRIDEDDLAAYEVVEHPALSGAHGTAELHTAGPTSGGPRLLDAFRHIARYQDGGGPLEARNYQLYADALNAAWRAHKRRTGRDVGPDGCTSHMSAVDSEGNMVALTYTLLNRFGSGVVLPATGLLMNNAVSYFDPRPGYPTSMAGRKRINVSNMCPTIASRDGQALFALGASGANHIVPCTTLIAAFMLEHGLSLEEAFNTPRIDASDRASVRVDPRVGDEVLAELGKSYELEVAQLLVFPKLFSCPSGVSRDPATGICQGITDPSQPVAGGAAPAPLVLEPPTASAGNGHIVRA